MSANESRLTIMLREMLVWCFDHPGARRKITLAGGLSVIVYIDLKNRRHVCLMRRGAVGPSEREAKTILERWPEARPEVITWSEGRAGQFALLVSIWDRPADRALVMGEEHAS